MVTLVQIFKYVTFYVTYLQQSPLYYYNYSTRQYFLSTLYLDNGYCFCFHAVLYKIQECYKLQNFNECYEK